MDFHNSLINASHQIEYLIFSEAPMPKPLSEHVLRMHNFISDAESRAYKVSGTNELRESMYTSLHEDRTFEHFVQVERLQCSSLLYYILTLHYAYSPASCYAPFVVCYADRPHLQQPAEDNSLQIHGDECRARRYRPLSFGEI